MKPLFLNGVLASILFVITGCGAITLTDTVFDLGVCHATNEVKDMYIKPDADECNRMCPDSREGSYGE